MFVRFIVKADLSSLNPVLNFEDLFEVETSGVGVNPADEIAESTIATNVYELIINKVEDYLTNGVCAMGVIRSRRDVDLRSNTTLTVVPGTRAMGNLYGLASSYLLDAWRAGTQSIGDSDLILEGGDI